MAAPWNKRGFDLVVILATSIFSVPLVAIIAVLVRIKLGVPVFFRQERPGLKGKVFVLIKFRTMTNERDESGRLLPDDARLTAFGRWLRASSMDELPELWNVLRGEMSLVGPRPLLVRYLGRYSQRQARRHDLRPGLTGLAQVMGRNSLSWDEKLEWDVRYVETRNFWLDMKIVWLTLGALISRNGIGAEGKATVPEFNPLIKKEDR